MAGRKQNSKVLMQQKRRRRQLLTFWRIVKYGANSFARNAWLSVAATAVMTITLLIIFGSVAAKNILNGTIDTIKDKVDMSIYLKKDISEATVEKIQSSLRGLKSVRDVKYVSAEEAKRNFTIKHLDNDGVQEALVESSNEFFGILNVKLVDIGDTKELEDFVNNNNDIKSNLDPNHKPTYAGDRKKTIENISNSVNFAEKVGLVAASIFTVIASLIIFNTIRMAIFNRREEIYMMKLIGANKSFIGGPFLVESVICGILAAILASIFGYLVIFFAKPKLDNYGVLVGDFMSNWVNYVIVIAPALMVLGSLIGVVSSILATRKYLKI